MKQLTTYDFATNEAISAIVAYLLHPKLYYKHFPADRSWGFEGKVIERASTHLGPMFKKYKR